MSAYNRGGRGGRGSKKLGQNYRSAFTNSKSGGIKSMNRSLLEDSTSERKANVQKAKETMDLTDRLDTSFGFDRHEEGERIGWLFNVVSSSKIDDELKVENSSVDLYFLENDGSTFKATFVYKPYFYLGINKV